MHLSLTLSDLAAEWPAVIEYVILFGLGSLAGGLAAWGYLAERKDRMEAHHRAALDKMERDHHRAVMQERMAAVEGASRQFRMGHDAGYDAGYRTGKLAGASRVARAFKPLMKLSEKTHRKN